MKKLTGSEYYRLNAFQKLLYKILCFICAIPSHLANLGVTVWKGTKQFGKWVKDDVLDVINTFRKGSWKTRLSYLIMGFGSLARGQILRGALFLVFEVVFIVYMLVAGCHWLGKFGTLGDVAPGEVYSEVYDTFVRVDGDDSFKILLYGILTIIFCIAFIYTWRINVRQNRISEEILAKGRKLATGRQDLKSLLDDQFYKTLLALPITGIVVFTILPIVFMIFVAFTNYDGAHDGYSNLFTWVGLDNFNELFSIGGASSNLSYTFGEILSWTLIWAFFATFTNYFLGMLVALLINKRGIKLKKLWRGILVLTIAIPQFVSLLYISKMFAKNGLINGFLFNMGLISQPIEFWTNPTYARILVILINIWVGIPYLMLIATGILMNIPQDLYESAKIDGASVFQQYTKITLPYMLFVTGPYLLTSFINNINNFNVIYLLTYEQVVEDPLLATGGQGATRVDLLITWLFKITTGATSNYKLAAVIAIMIFVVVAALSLIVYNVMPATRNEEDFQ